MSQTQRLRLRRLILGLLFLVAAGGRTSAAAPPHIVFLSVDTLRLDRMSFYGYSRPTTPNLDELLGEGVAFEQARVAEPLTAPSMISMLTSLHPHEHGASRNGLRMRARIPSLVKQLRRNGYHAAAFVGNWTLKDEITGLGEHFSDYREIFTRKRWLGLMNSEATARDLNGEALAWIEEHLESSSKPMLVWVHYVEPHAPYVLQEEFVEPLAISSHADIGSRDRYDTEVAYVDRAIGDFLDRLAKLLPASQTMILFASDHGESLGEHNYWGHGRHLYDVTLRVPMAIVWKGRLEARRLETLASSLDLAPTVLGLLDLPIPKHFQGYDWSPAIRGGVMPAPGRATFHQAHKGAVHGGRAALARRKGLLEIGRVEAGAKEILRLRSETLRRFDLVADPGENNDQNPPEASPSADLASWLEDIRAGLSSSDQEMPASSLDEESVEKLRALGYID